MTANTTNNQLPFDLDKGYVITYRGEREMEIFTKGKNGRTKYDVWQYLKSHASYKDTTDLGVNVSRGQLLTSNSILCEKCELANLMSANRILNELVSVGLIEVSVVKIDKSVLLRQSLKQMLRQMTLITICNYDIYNGGKTENVKANVKANVILKNNELKNNLENNITKEYICRGFSKEKLLSLFFQKTPQTIKEEYSGDYSGLFKNSLDAYSKLDEYDRLFVNGIQQTIGWDNDSVGNLTTFKLDGYRNLLVNMESIGINANDTTNEIKELLGRYKTFANSKKTDHKYIGNLTGDLLVTLTKRHTHINDKKQSSNKEEYDDLPFD